MNEWMDKCKNEWIDVLGGYKDEWMYVLSGCIDECKTV